MTQQQQFTITELTANTIDAGNRMRLASWLDTYVNEDLGVTREWIEERNKGQMSAEKHAQRLQKLDDPNSAGWVALDSNGTIIGMTTAYVGDNGTQHVGALYVDKKWHGKDVANALMQKVIEWFNPGKPIELGVASYNGRAKAFYRKWDFREVAGSETLFADKIPEVKMVRAVK